MRRIAGYPRHFFVYLFLSIFVITPALFGKTKDESRKKSSIRSKTESALKNVPPPGGDLNESDAIKKHGLRNWRLMTYPGKTIPSQAMTKARAWIRDSVKDSEPWRIPSGTVKGFSPLAVTPPGTAQWIPYGPTPLDSIGSSTGFTYGTVSGRVNAIAVDPNNPDVAYIGAASGGVWKTTNLSSPNVTWTPLFDGEEIVTQAVGAIEIDPNDSNVIYVGTGDFNASDQHGEGIMKSTDGGSTWTQIGASVFTPYAPSTPLWANQNIGAIEVDPNDSNNILVGTRFDLFLTHDAGANWQRCSFGANPTDPSSASNPIQSINRISGIVLDSSTNPTTVFVAVGFTSSLYNGNNGVYKGTVPGVGCPALSLVNNGWPSGTGNGNNGATAVGRIRLASSRGNEANNLVVYAQVQNTSGNNALGTYLTTNQGGTWKLLKNSANSNYKNCFNGPVNQQQDWYDLFIAADPADDRNLYIGRVDIFKARVNEKHTSFSSLTNLTNVYTTNCPEYGSVHPDQHMFAWVGNTGSSFLAGNDGGVYYNNAAGALGGWKQVNDSISTIQFYAGQIGSDFASGGLQIAFGGAQDNGNMSWDSTQSDPTWLARSVGGDGFFTAFDHIASGINTGRWYTEYVYGNLYCSGNGATGFFGRCNPNWGPTERQDWSTPYLLDPNHCSDTNCNNLIIGSSVVYVSASNGSPVWVRTGTTDLTKGSTTAGTIISLNLAPNEPKTAVVGTSDGNVQWSNNVFTGVDCTQGDADTSSFVCDGNPAATWVNLTQGNAVLPNRAIQGVAFAPDDSQTLYAAVGGFDDNTVITPGHLFRATCASGCATPGNWTWANKTGNLPDVPALSVAVHPDIPEMVFLGTDAGFFYTNDITAVTPVWERYQWGLPNTKIQHLTIDRRSPAASGFPRTLAVYTYGRGMYAISLPATSDGFCDHPAAPTGFTATTPVANRIDLTWNAPALATGYNIYRSMSGCPGGAFQLIASDVATTTFQDNTVNGGTTYSYKIEAINGIAECASNLTSCEDATATCATLGAPAITSILDVSNCAESGIQISYTSGAGAISHDLYQDGILVVADYSSGETFFPGDIGTHSYLVRGVDGACGADSNAMNGVDENNSGIALDPANPPDGTGDEIYGGFTFMATGGTGTLTFSATGLPNGLIVNEAGDLSGTPTETGTFQVDVTATDTPGCSNHRVYTLIIEVGCLYCDDFNDGNLAGDWNYIKPGWSESGGNLVATPTGKKATAIAEPAFGGCTNCTIQATMETAGGQGNLLVLIGWYADSKNKLELLMKEEKDKWLLKERIAGSVAEKAKGNREILPGVSYNVELVFTGSLYRLFVDSDLVLELTPAGPHSGTVGFEAKNTVGTFGEIFVD